MFPDLPIESTVAVQEGVDPGGAKPERFSTLNAGRAAEHAGAREAHDGRRREKSRSRPNSSAMLVR